MSTILLVDDDTETLEIYSQLLEWMGHRVLCAHDGEEALEWVWRQRPDLVVTDWMMPRMNGVELCRALTGLEDFQGVPIIMHSSSGNPHVPELLAFVPKSGDLEHFEQVVTQGLQCASRHCSGHVAWCPSRCDSGWDATRCT